MTVDVLFALACIVVVLAVFGSRFRSQKAVIQSRGQVLQALAPVVGGSLSDRLELAGTYKGHPCEATLQTTARYDTIGASSSHSSFSRIPVLLLKFHRVSGIHPWGFYTSLGPAPLVEKWRSVIASAGALERLFVSVAASPVDPAIDDKLRAGGMLEAMERLAPEGQTAPYVFVTFVPDGASAVARTVQRVDAVGGKRAGEADREAAAVLRQGGHLRIEVERAEETDPDPEQFRRILEAAVGIAELNAAINIRASEA
jgi:hypothetical protein